MADIRFYHMERSDLEQVLPALLNKALQGGYKIIVKCENDSEAERLSTHLWAYDPASFLPHGTKKDGEPESQPVYLTANDENPNAANVLILTGGANAGDLSGYEMVCEMFNGRNEEAVLIARARWKTYKDDGHDVTYWQQGDRGWEKKA